MRKSEGKYDLHLSNGDSNLTNNFRGGVEGREGASYIWGSACKYDITFFNATQIEPTIFIQHTRHSCHSITVRFNLPVGVFLFSFENNQELFSSFRSPSQRSVRLQRLTNDPPNPLYKIYSQVVGKEPKDLDQASF